MTRLGFERMALAATVVAALAGGAAQAVDAETYERTGLEHTLAASTPDDRVQAARIGRDISMRVLTESRVASLPASDLRLAATRRAEVERS